MFTKDQVINKLDALLAYTISQIPTLTYPNKDEYEPIYTGIVAPAKTKVTGYFDASRSQFQKPLDDLGLYMHNEVWQREAKWEIPFDLGLGTNPPETYHDLRKIFYSFDWFMNLTDQDFFNAWVYGEKPTPEGEEPPLNPEIIPLSNSYITRLTSEIVLTAVSDPETGKVSKTTIEAELEAITALSKWLENSMSQSSSVTLWEDQGQLLETITTQDVAQIIFVERGLLEAVKILKLPVYIPTYLRGE